jgi:hypothetical protein
VATPIRRTSANGIPLAAEAAEDYFKVCLLDVGLYMAQCGLDATYLARAQDLLLVNGGQLAEQFVGQQLRSARPYYQEPELFCWAREQRTSNAEVDYVIQHGADIVPVEVKAGSTGQLRSLHVFLREKRRSLGVRLGGNEPALIRAHTALPDGPQVPFRLLSLPLYLTGQLRRLLSEVPQATEPPEREASEALDKG